MTCTMHEAVSLADLVALHGDPAEHKALEQRLRHSPLTLVTPWAARHPVHHHGRFKIEGTDREVRALVFIRILIDMLHRTSGIQPTWVPILADEYARINGVDPTFAANYFAELSGLMTDLVPGVVIRTCSDLLSLVDADMEAEVERQLAEVGTAHPGLMVSIAARSQKVAPGSDPMAYVHERLLEAHVCHVIFGNPVKLATTARDTNTGLDGSLLHLYLPEHLQNPWRHAHRHA